MLMGVMFALAAGLMWGLIFVGPTIVPEYPAAMLSAGRYVAFGIIAASLGMLDRQRLRKLSRADWTEATKLTVVGNLIYYFFLASAIQRTGAPVSTMIIGTLPVVMTVTANVLYGRYEGKLSLQQLLPVLVLIALGLVCVNIAELRSAVIDVTSLDYLLGVVQAIAAVVCWTWYAMRNARWLRTHPGHNPMTWATAQGVVTLPLALLAYLVVCGVLTQSNTGFMLPFGPRPVLFVGLMISIGFFCSWLGTLCWNEASQRLPTVMMGAMITFEIIAGLVYAFILRESWPSVLIWSGVAFLIAGVLYTARLKPRSGQQ
jgi:drug/metabolite transporter (DMT)-like permease